MAHEASSRLREADTGTSLAKCSAFPWGNAEQVVVGGSTRSWHRKRSGSARQKPDTSVLLPRRAIVYGTAQVDLDLGYPNRN